MGMHKKTSAALAELLALITSGEVGGDGYVPSRIRVAELLGIGRGAVPSLLAELARRGITDRAAGRHIRILSSRGGPDLQRRKILIFGRDCADIRQILDRRKTALEVLPIFRGIEAAARESGIDLLTRFDPMPVTPEGLVYRCRREHVNGIIQIEYVSPEVVAESRRAGIPLVAANLESAEVLPASCMDFRRIGREAGRMLAERGHRRIAFLASASNPWIYREMFAGFKGALAEDDIPLLPGMPLGMDFHNAELCIGRIRDLLLSRGRPTAVFTGRDRYAAFVYAAANRLGLRIPEDLSVLGYDNLSWPDGRYFGLSTLEQPVTQIGRAAVEEMIRCWNSGGDAPAPIRLGPGPLIDRGSLAAAPSRVAPGIRA